LLEIVAKSLYQDKEVFIRELLSNAADALEKQRYMQMSGKDVTPGDPLQVSIIVSEAKKQIIIQDTGIGLNL
jgi:HSP90 family molecular chaperone